MIILYNEEIISNKEDNKCYYLQSVMKFALTEFERIYVLQPPKKEKNDNWFNCWNKRKRNISIL